MTTRMAVKNLSRITGGKVRWRVSCPICSDDGFLMALSPVVDAHDLADALWWARWHAAEHERTACRCCGHMPPVPVVKPLDSNAVRVGDRLFVRQGREWVEVDGPDVKGQSHEEACTRA